jgi:hypothetical protein
VTHAFDGVEQGQLRPGMWALLPGAEDEHEGGVDGEDVGM